MYTDVYVSRYWTKVAPSVLDATRSDISPGTGFFVTRGRNYETGHFSQTAAGCRNTESALPLPWHLSFSLSFSFCPPSSLPRQRNIWTLYALRAIGLGIGLIDASSTVKCNRCTCVFISLTGTFVSNVQCFTLALSNFGIKHEILNQLNFYFSITIVFYRIAQYSIWMEFINILKVFYFRACIKLHWRWKYMGYKI